MRTIFLKEQLQSQTPFSGTEGVCLQELLLYLDHFLQVASYSFVQRHHHMYRVPTIITTNEVNKMNIHLECKE